jgi:tRNA uridine 5-carbamoylmethylation protein Kti12
MNYFVIIRGPLGVGKTTISKRLAKTLKAEYVSIDKILKDNDLDNIDPKLECIPIENFIKVNEIILPESRSMLGDGKNVIIDGAFYHKEAIEHLISNLEFPHFVFTLKASVKECIKRDKERQHSYGIEAVRGVYNLVDRFDYGVNIDIDKKTINQVVGELKKQLPSK